MIGTQLSEDEFLEKLEQIKHDGTIFGVAYDLDTDQVVIGIIDQGMLTLFYSPFMMKIPMDEFNSFIEKLRELYHLPPSKEAH